MITTRWQKQNSTIFPYAWLIVFISLLFPVWPVTLLGIEGNLGLLITAISIILPIILAVLVLRWRAQTMVRVLKSNYKEIEVDLRALFESHKISFDKTGEKGAIHYRFHDSHGLNLTIQPYPLLKSEIEKPRKAAKSVTKITLSKLNQENNAMADQVAQLIDTMADQNT